MPADPTVFTAIPLSELLQLFDELLDKKINFIRMLQVQPDETLMTIEEAGELLRVIKVTIHKWKKQKRVKAYRIGRRIYFKKQELLNAIL